MHCICTSADALCCDWAVVVAVAPAAAVVVLIADDEFHCLAVLCRCMVLYTVRATHRHQQQAPLQQMLLRQAVKPKMAADSSTTQLLLAVAVAAPPGWTSLWPLQKRLMRTAGGTEHGNRMYSQQRAVDQAGALAHM
jgi:hypothetical protein